VQGVDFLRKSTLWRCGTGYIYRDFALGSNLLAKALKKAFTNAAQVGSSMVVVDAINEKAANFYKTHGFIPLPESMRLVLPMQTIAGLFSI
jgi:predicted GNAT family N-acyltransferase